MISQRQIELSKEQLALMICTVFGKFSLIFGDDNLQSRKLAREQRRTKIFPVTRNDTCGYQGRIGRRMPKDN